MRPRLDLVERFRSDLDALIGADEMLGLAVSGGPDSFALLLLAAAARPGRIEAATVDHGLRPAGESEAIMVGNACRSLGVRHAVLTARWTVPPETAIQEQARRMRYRLLSYWAEEQRLSALVTAHHADDQAETLLMRLARGSGVRGLAAMRPRSITTGSHIRLLRPLLGWRKGELEQICTDASVTPVADTSNSDPGFERVRVRQALAKSKWLDAGAVARSAAHLAEADIALDWAVELEWKNSVEERHGRFVYHRPNSPSEIMRRMIARVVRRLATEGGTDLRGRELDTIMEVLLKGEVATIRGVRCEGGSDWRFSRAAPRRQ